MPATEGFGLSLPKELLPTQCQPTSLSPVSALISLLLLKLCQQKSIERCLFGNKTNPWLTGRDIRYLHAREIARPFRMQLHTNQVYLKDKSQAIAGYELAKRKCVGVLISDLIKWRANSSLSYTPVFLYLFLGCSTHLHAWPIYVLLISSQVLCCFTVKSFVCVLIAECKTEDTGALSPDFVVVMVIFKHTHTDMHKQHKGYLTFLPEESCLFWCSERIWVCKI